MALCTPVPAHSVIYHRYMIMWIVLTSILAYVVVNILIFTLGCSDPPALFSICSASGKFLNGSDSQVTANWDVEFCVAKKSSWESMYYDPMQSSVFHSKESVSNFTLEPFEQHGHDVISAIHARFEAMTLTIDARFPDNGTCGVSYTDFKLRGTVLSKRPQTRDMIQVRCERVPLVFCSNISLSVNPAPCLSESVLERQRYRVVLILELVAAIVELIIVAICGVFYCIYLF